MPAFSFGVSAFQQWGWHLLFPNNPPSPNELPCCLPSHCFFFTFPNTGFLHAPRYSCNLKKPSQVSGGSLLLPGYTCPISKQMVWLCPSCVTCHLFHSRSGQIPTFLQAFGREGGPSSNPYPDNLWLPWLGMSCIKPFWGINRWSSANHLFIKRPKKRIRPLFKDLIWEFNSLPQLPVCLQSNGSYPMNLK